MLFSIEFRVLWFQSDQANDWLPEPRVGLAHYGCGWPGSGGAKSSFVCTRRVTRQCRNGAWQPVVQSTSIVSKDV